LTFRQYIILCKRLPIYLLEALPIFFFLEIGEHQHFYSFLFGCTTLPHLEGVFGQGEEKQKNCVFVVNMTSEHGNSIFYRSIFEEYRRRDALLGLDSGAWEDTNPEGTFLPPKEEVNVDKDSILDYITSKGGFNLVSSPDTAQKPSVRTHYGRSPFLPPNCREDHSKENHKKDKQKEEGQQKLERMTNMELYTAFSAWTDKQEYHDLLNKLNPNEKDKYCAKFGCTNKPRRRGLCGKHYVQKRKNPNMPIRRHAYCYRFSFFSSVEEYDYPGDDSDSCWTSEYDSDGEEEWSEEEKKVEEEEEKEYNDKHLEEVYVEDDDPFIYPKENIEKERKCINYSCSDDIYCKKIALCRKHYRIM